MKKTTKQDDAANFRTGAELPQPCGTSGDEVPQSITERLRLLIGSQSTAEFARKCEIGESLLRQYLGGSMPGADKLAKIAIAAHVSLDWLAVGRGPMHYEGTLQRSHEDRIKGTYLHDETAARRADEYARRAIEERIKLPTETVLRIAREEQIEPSGLWITLLVELLALGQITEAGARRVLQHLKLQ